MSLTEQERQTITDLAQVLHEHGDAAGAVIVFNSAVELDDLYATIAMLHEDPSVDRIGITVITEENHSSYQTPAEISEAVRNCRANGGPAPER